MRIWTIRHLKKTGIPTNQLLKIYCAMIRPVLEFGAVSFHSLLTGEQSLALERLQRIALQTIYGVEKSYESCLEEAQLPRLEERRQKLLENFAVKNQNGRYATKWFPKNDPKEYELRRTEMYRVMKTNSERLKNSPLNQMRRVLNSLVDINPESELLREQNITLYD
jgi:hypothetical protein